MDGAVACPYFLQKKNHLLCELGGRRRRPSRVIENWGSLTASPVLNFKMCRVFWCWIRAFGTFLEGLVISNSSCKPFSFSHISKQPFCQIFLSAPNWGQQNGCSRGKACWLSVLLCPWISSFQYSTASTESAVWQWQIQTKVRWQQSCLS